MDLKRALEAVERALLEVKEENKTIPIIVEGEKDIQALRLLGITGMIIRINRGMSLTDFCDWVTAHFTKIIILTDWDRRGGSLCRTMMKQLKGRVDYNTTFREILAKNAMVRTVEELPSWLFTMKGKQEKR